MLLERQCGEKAGGGYGRELYWLGGYVLGAFFYRDGDWDGEGGGGGGDFGGVFEGVFGGVNIWEGVYWGGGRKEERGCGRVG
jgi:hypothetical protein